MPLTVRVPSTAPGARYTTYAVVLSDEVDDLNLVPVSCECKGWRFHGHCKHGAMALAMAVASAEAACTCPEWRHPDDFDGPQDYAAACGRCPVHG